MEIKNIKQTQIPAFFDQLIQSGKVVIAPVLKKSGKVFFEPVQSYNQVATDYIQTGFSAKSVVFPKVEVLFSFKKTEDGIEIQDSIANIPETIVWGLRPCDGSAFNYMTEFFLKENPDTYYAARKAKTTLIAISCAKADDACFCTSVGLNPGSTAGSDVLLTLMGEDVYVEVLTEKGKAAIGISASSMPWRSW